MGHGIRSCGLGATPRAIRRAVRQDVRARTATRLMGSALVTTAATGGAIAQAGARERPPQAATRRRDTVEGFERPGNPYVSTGIDVATFGVAVAMYVLAAREIRQTGAIRRGPLRLIDTAMFAAGAMVVATHLVEPWHAVSDFAIFAYAAFVVPICSGVLQGKFSRWLTKHTH